MIRHVHSVILNGNGETQKKSLCFKIRKLTKENNHSIFCSSNSSQASYEDCNHEPRRNQSDL